MNWTNEKPTAPGWYWNRSKLHTADEWFVQIVKREHSSHGAHNTDFMDGQFAGPIPEPVEVAFTESEVNKAFGIIERSLLKAYMRRVIAVEGVAFITDSQDYGAAPLTPEQRAALEAIEVEIRAEDDSK